MFFTDRLMLRCIDPEADNAIWLQWTNDVDSMNAISLQGTQPWSREKSKQVLETRTKDKDALPWFMICERPTVENEPASVLGPNDDYFRTADGKARYPAIGMLTMDRTGPAQDVNRTVGFGILFNKKHQGNSLPMEETISSHSPVAERRTGKGLGTEVLRWMCNHVFSTLGYHRIELTLDATNARALSCYRTVGFVEEGRRRKKFWREGEWRDVLEMAMLEEEWFGKHRLQVE
jgi:RimJ/RimL family protein N-acetyltransferase